ncbi:gas vesicle accessory protein GvpU [uncultured Metabacillus sp.]|uniref:gas vesicle accessory protein GvpU n=1 Tax=uncultured Metabacillus sp. TaxID=2860135 RepID=UPI00261E9743|nr:gas vesicle accessory protein GvpU [uncultured Metabacillus sp.]
MAKKEQQTGTDDAIILMFLDLVEEDGIEVEVTLSVQGAIISGTLIGASAYYEGVTEASKHLQDSTMSKIISKKFGDLKEAYAKQKQEEAEKEQKGSLKTFIHLKHAKYHSKPTQLPNGSWWRGRISSIDGFSFDLLN